LKLNKDEMFKVFVKNVRMAKAEECVEIK